MPTLSQLIKSKTMLFSVGLAMLSVSQGFIVELAITPIQQGIVGMIIAGAIAALRIITTTAIADKYGARNERPTNTTPLLAGFGLLYY